MPVDSSIYGMIQTPDIIGGIRQGMQLRELMDQRAQRQKQIADESAVAQAYKNNVTVGEDGRTNVNKRLFSDLAGVSPKLALEAQDKFNQDEINRQKMAKDKMAQEAEMVSRIRPSIKDQGSYEQALGYLSQNGVDVAKMPKGYDPGLLDKIYLSARSLTDQMKDTQNQQEMNMRERELYSRSLDRKEGRDERRFLAGIKEEERVQSLTTPYGLAHTKDDAKQLKEAHESKSNFDSKLNELIGLRQKYGVEYMNRNAVARGKQLSKDLLLEYKNMAKLGVLSKSDEDIINAIIPEDPLGQDFALGQDPILHKLSKFKQDSDKDFQTRVQTRTRSGNPTQITQGAPKAGDVDGGFIFMGGDPGDKNNWKKASSVSSAQGGR